MGLDSPISILALAISPVVAGVFVLVLRSKRDAASQPSIVAAIPFCLASIALLLAQSSFVILSTFNQIATQRMTGIAAVVSGLLRAQRPLAWGFLDAAACVAFLLLVSAARRYSSDEETPLVPAYVSLPALIATALFLFSLFLIAYFQWNTVDLVMMVVDRHRNQELASLYPGLGMGELAAKISFRLTSTIALSALQFLALLVAGILNLFWRQTKDQRPTFGILLALGALAGCGLLALNEFSFLSYLLRAR